MKKVSVVVVYVCFPALVCSNAQTVHECGIGIPIDDSVFKMLAENPVIRTI